MSTPFLPTPADTQAAKQQLEHFIDSSTLPPRLSQLMTDLLSQLADGKAVLVTTVDTEISTQQAAELIGVSRPYLVKLLEQGILPFRKIGPRRRIHLQDVLSYKAKLDAQRQEALQELADELQDLGLV